MARLWSDLPPELLNLISCRVFAGDYVSFKLVCKSWLSVCTISPVPLPPLTDPSVSQCPQLMFQYRTTGLFKFFHPVCNASSKVDIPELPYITIRFSQYDWLLVSDERRLSLYFFNPFTKHRINLPDIPSGFATMCFTSTPTSPDCIVFGFYDLGAGSTEIGILRVNTSATLVWDVRTYINNSRFLFADCSPVLCNGFLHCLSMTGKLGVFGPIDDNSIKTNNFHWTIHGKLSPPKLNKWSQRFLVECDGDIFSVFICNHGNAGVHVLRLDCTMMKWVRVESLGDKMLFVCPYSSFSEKAIIGGVGNKVYFNMLFKGDGVFYSLTTKMFHSFNGNCLKTNIEHIGVMLGSTWIKPCLQQF